ncbi:MAG: hypothetical protein EBR30_14450 [Cytophagia bacterium]|nr:hypothetical protein [Cytophagia bacterium]
MRTLYLIGILSLVAASSSDLQTLDLKYFSIEVPKNWRYIKQQGIDSFVGEIRGPRVKLSFDCSSMGYANNLIQTPEEYIKRQILISYSFLFSKPDVIYTLKESVENVRNAEMKKLNTNDTSLVKVRPYIRPTSKIYLPTKNDLVKFKNADYLVDLTHNDSTITVGVALPDDIRKHNIKIDTIGQFVVKTIWPKKTGDGMTGVYYKKIKAILTCR